MAKLSLTIALIAAFATISASGLDFHRPSNRRHNKNNNNNNNNNYNKRHSTPQTGYDSSVYRPSTYDSDDSFEFNANNAVQQPALSSMAPKPSPASLPTAPQVSSLRPAPVVEMPHQQVYSDPQASYPAQQSHSAPQQYSAPPSYQPQISQQYHQQQQQYVPPTSISEPRIPQPQYYYPPPAPAPPQLNPTFERNIKLIHLNVLKAIAKRAPEDLGSQQDKNKLLDIAVDELYNSHNMRVPWLFGMKYVALYDKAISRPCTQVKQYSIIYKNHIEDLIRYYPHSDRTELYVLKIGDICKIMNNDVFRYKVKQKLEPLIKMSINRPRSCFGCFA